MTFNLLAFHNELQKKGIFFGFTGPITQELLAEMGEILKQKMKLREAPSPTILKVFSMVVEQLQNIIHYSAEKVHKNDPDAPNLSTGMIAVGFFEGEYFVTCGNMIENEEVPRLEQMLKELQTLNPDRLKEFYKEKRRQGPGPLSKGAGLGFIEMARKACRPLEYQFEGIDDQYTFFTVNAFI